MSDPLRSRIAGSLRLGGAPILVLLRDMAKGEFGECESFPAEWLAVNRRLHRGVRAQTILHELIHLIDTRYDIKLSEAKTRCLEQALASLVRENPQAARRWLEDILSQ